MKKIFILILAIAGNWLLLNTQLFAASEVDIEAIKEEIKNELRGERPWKEEIESWKIDVHGFVSQGYMNSYSNNFLANDSSTGTFQFDEVGINFSKQLTDKLRIGIQLFAHDLGAIGNNKITIDWAVADYRWQDWLGIRAGKIKAPHGLYNESRDIDMLRTSILLPQSVYTEFNRDTMVAIQGLGLYGNIPIGPIGRLSYYLLGGTTDVSEGEDNGAVRLFNSSSPILEQTGDWDIEEIYIGSLTWVTPFDGLLFKTTYRRSNFAIPGQLSVDFLGPGTAGTPVNTDMANHTIVVYSVEYTWEDLVLAAEYQRTREPLKIDFPTLNNYIFADTIIKQDGYYVSADYRFTDWFEAGFYYSSFCANSTDRDGNDLVGPLTLTYNYQNWLKDTALSLRFDITDNWVFKLEGHRMDGAALVLSMDNDDFEKDWYVLAAKVTFSF